CGIPWIPTTLIEPFLTTKWKLLDYSSNQIEYSEVAKQEPIAVLAYLPPEEIRTIPSVKWLLTPGAGVDMWPLERVKQDEQILINCHANANTVAEHAWALLLSASRNIPKYDSFVRESGNWPSFSQIFDLNNDISGKSIGIVGYGAIGKTIARYALAFDMNIVVFRKHPDEGEFDTFDLQNHVDELDFLMISCPLTVETRGLVSKEVIDALPSHAIIVNIARGEIIDEQALFASLREGRLRAAASDVWQNSPYRKSVGLKPEEFIDIESLVISPHRAWVSKESHAQVAQELAHELDLIAKGEESANLVDLDREY
ncbi:MAG: NAD(P)-dependent oxidoreductase, partial [Candidatus Kariarchaeaceae archaeon]